jgi:hypothetical protein
VPARHDRDVLEQRAAEAAADPGRLDPEILEPADLAARDQRRPSDRPSVRLGDVEQTAAQALGVEVAAARPLLDLRPVVAPVRLRLDGDRAQPLEVGLGSLTDANAARLRP